MTTSLTQLFSSGSRFKAGRQTLLICQTTDQKWQKAAASVDHFLTLAQWKSLSVMLFLWLLLNPRLSCKWSEFWLLDLFKWSDKDCLHVLYWSNAFTVCIYFMDVTTMFSFQSVLLTWSTSAPMPFLQDELKSTTLRLRFSCSCCTTPVIDLIKKLEAGSNKHWMEMSVIYSAHFNKEAVSQSFRLSCVLGRWILVAPVAQKCIRPLY